MLSEMTSGGDGMASQFKNSSLSNSVYVYWLPGDQLTRSRKVIIKKLTNEIMLKREGFTLKWLV